LSGGRLQRSAIHDAIACLTERRAVEFPVARLLKLRQLAPDDALSDDRLGPEFVRACRHRKQVAQTLLL
jgi:hypothetical protein